MFTFNPMVVFNNDYPTPAKKQIVPAPVSKIVAAFAAVISAMPAYPNQQTLMDIAQNGLNSDAVLHLLKMMPADEMWPKIHIDQQSIQPASDLLTHHMHRIQTGNPDILNCTFNGETIEVNTRHNLIILNDNCVFMPYYLGSDDSAGIYVYFYIDNSKLHVYVPIHGNYINMDFKTAVGIEHDAIASNIKLSDITALESKYANDGLHCPKMDATKTAYFTTQNNAEALGSVWNMRYLNKYDITCLLYVLPRLGFNPDSVDMSCLIARITSNQTYGILVTDFYGICPISTDNAQAMLDELETIFS